MKQAIKLQYGQNEEEEGESEVINRKFIRLLQFRDAPSEETQPTFDSKEIETISHRFKQLCNDDQMNYEQFRRGLGLLGRQDSFICRIFNLIDEDGDGYITQQNFLEYLSIILRGSDLQKARFGWMILT